MRYSRNRVPTFSPWPVDVIDERKEVVIDKIDRVALEHSSPP